MRFQVSSHLEYTVKFPSTLIFNIHAQRNHAQTILDEHFSVKPHIPIEEFVLEQDGNRFVRLETLGSPAAIWIAPLPRPAAPPCTHGRRFISPCSAGAASTPLSASPHR